MSIIVLFRIVIFVTTWLLNEKMVPNIRSVGMYKAPSWHSSPVTRWHLQLEDRWGVTPGCHRYSFFMSVNAFGCNSMMTSSNGNIFALLALFAGKSPVTSEIPSQRQIVRSFYVSLIWAFTNNRISNRDAGHLSRHGAHYDVNVMKSSMFNPS